MSDSLMLLQKSDREQFAYVALNKRVIWVICVLFELIACKNERFALKRHVFCLFLTVFPTFLCPRANSSRCSSLVCFFFKSNLSDLVPLIFTKERPWVICSGRSWQKSDCEGFAQVAQDKRVTVNNSLRLFMTKERREQFTLNNEWIAL